ncbi:hypothetical protein [Methylogaea oryzae]|uniref:hypothetical protein n=1 Tax=Methylogaea oryzae TaxID=1295382 RepID=UPI0020D034BB|nr:hypothetical protein [Methylogaea oryzae]
MPNATLSFHVKELVNAGLVVARQEGRYIYYAADYAAMNAVVAFLTENCCGGQPCGPADCCAAPNPPESINDETSP